jgi:hypothetical protein
VTRLYAKLSKREYWLKEVSFFAHVILKGGISVDSIKIRDVLSCDTSASVTDIQSFLELVGYYWRFIEGFSKITKSMTELLRKDKKFKWSPAFEVSF